MANDPIQGLIDYVNEIKPFHTKILEIAVAYAQNDDTDVTFTEDMGLDIAIYWPGVVGSPDEGPIRVCTAGYGVMYDRQTPYFIVNADASPQTVSLQGDQTAALDVGVCIEVREPYTDDFLGSPISESTPRYATMVVTSVQYDVDTNTTLVGVIVKVEGWLGSPIVWLGSPSTTPTGSPPFSGTEFWFPPYDGNVSNGDVFVVYDVVSTSTLNLDLTRPIEWYGSPIVGSASPFTPIWPSSAGSPLPGSPKVVIGSPATYPNFGSPLPSAGNTITIKSPTPGVFLYGQEVEIRNASNVDLNRNYNILNAVDLGGSPNLVQLTMLDHILADSTNDGELVFTPDGFSGGDLCGDVPPEILQTVWLENLDMTWRFAESPLEENFQLFILEADSVANTYTVQGDTRSLMTYGSPPVYGLGSPAVINISVQHGVTAFGSPYNTTLNANNGSGTVQDITYNVDTNRSTITMDNVSISTPTGWITFNRLLDPLTGSLATIYYSMDGNGSPIGNNEGTGGGSPPVLASVYDMELGNGLTWGTRSLLESGAGTSFTTTTNGYVASNNWRPRFDQGFTVEYLVQPTSIYARAAGGGTGRTCVGLATTSNSVFLGTFGLRFDNYLGGSPTLETSVTPNFFIQDLIQVDDIVTYESAVLANARGTTSFSSIVGSPAPVYHLLGTYSPTLGKLDLYVNGTLEASTDLTTIAGSPTANFLRIGGVTGYDLTNRARANRDYLSWGALFIDGAWRAGQSGSIDEVLFHEGLYMDAEQAEAQARKRRL